MPPQKSHEVVITKNSIVKRIEKDLLLYIVGLSLIIILVRFGLKQYRKLKIIIKQRIVN